MAKFTKVSTLVVDCSDWGFGPFEVLMVPNDPPEAITKEYACWFDYYLRHPRYGHVQCMFGCGAESEEHAVELGYNNAPDYIPYYIEEVIDCE